MAVRSADATTRPESCDCSGVDQPGDPLPCVDCWLAGFDEPNPEAGDR